MKISLARVVAIRFLMVAISALPLPACAGLSGGPIEGSVRDAQTNQPIADAIVVARWQGHLASWAHGKTVCYHVLSTTTNAEGRYHFPAWKKDITEDWQKNIRPERVLIDAYKRGYGLRGAPEESPNDRLLEPFTGTREERLEYLLRVFSSTGCDARSASAKNAIPLLKALYTEAESLAQTEDEKRKVESIRYSLEILKFGFEEAEQRYLQRSR